MIFEDRSEKRWKKALIVFIAFGIVGLLIIADLLYSFIVNPSLPTISRINQEKGAFIKAQIEKSEVKVPAEPKNRPVIVSSEPQKETKKVDRNSVKTGNKLDFNFKHRFINSAFIVQDDPQSVEDAKKHVENLDVVFPDCFSIKPDSGEIVQNIDSSLLSFFQNTNVLLLPRLSNTDENGGWLGTEFGSIIKDSENRTILIENILKALQRYNLKGINLDIENLDQESREDYLDFLSELKDLLHQNRMYLTVDVPMNDSAFDYESIGEIADMAVVMAYDEHYAGGESGPIASQSWFTDGIDEMVKKIPKEKLLVGLGQYAYDWNTSKKSSADTMGFDETMTLANEVEADVQTDKDSINGNFSYQDSKGDKHSVWFLDAISLWNQYQISQKDDVLGISLWRTGLEDPTIWNFLSVSNAEHFNPKGLEKVKTLDQVEYEGEGEILKVSSMPAEGKRILTFDGNLIDSADYDKLPTNFEVQKFGHLNRKNIVLTFDDGPDPVFTPQILDVLKDNGVTASFFIVGDQAQKHPELIKRELKDGHLIGNHTYLHPNLAQISGSRIGLELNSTERLIEALTGRETMLFRPPYNTDTSPSSPEELAPIYTANKLGYIMVGADIDSADYEKPGVDKIVSNVLNQLEKNDSNIIVMHDAGGDRSQTVETLRKLIPLLKDKGYQFVNVNDLLGVPKGSLMPKIGLKEQFVVWADIIWTWIRVWGWNIIVVLFFITTLISVFRIIFLGFFVLRSNRAQKKYKPVEGFEPFVSVIIPAYNEEKVIGRTIEWLVKSTYKNFEVIVVDDGSTDETCNVVEDFIKANPNIRLISKKNGGKFSALNLGFREAKADFIVTIDADTIILPDTIRNLIAPFADENVDAVCGNVNVGNVKNILTGFQAVEYITTQNYDRRAFDDLNCISVVPGATGAWKKEKVLECGGYSHLTLTEDADLTLTMLEHGARIVYSPEAKSITEAPESISALFKQRFRWSFGTLQCLWKHRKSFLKGNLGWVALPNVLLFQTIFPVLSPIGDLVFILSIFRGDVGAILSGYILFLIMDLAASLMAFTIEDAPKKYLFFILIQRFFYRQFMYLVTFNTLAAAIRGRRHGWNKLERTNSVET